MNGNKETALNQFCLIVSVLAVLQVRDHGRKLLEKHVKKPFFDAE